MFERIPGSENLVAPIQFARDSAGNHASSSMMSSGKYDSDAYPPFHNYVFLEAATETFRLLLPSNSWRVLSKANFPESDSRSTAPAATLWFVYEIVKADTNGDGTLSAKDLITVALSDATGQNYTELIADVESVNTKVMRDPETLLVVFRSNGRTQLARVDLKSRKVANVAELPSFGSDVR